MMVNKSPYSLNETLGRLLKVLIEYNMMIFAIVDHSGGAAQVGLSMPNTKLVIFGNIGQVKEMRKEYGKLNKMDMSIWECCELLNNVVDDSDPDLDEPQIQHLLQTAEAIRRDYPKEDWLHLTALIHGTCLVLLYHNDIIYHNYLYAHF